MQEETQQIVNELTEKFTILEDWCRATRPRRIFAEVPRQNVMAVITYAKESLGFCMLCTITGLDSGDNFEVIYHLAKNDGVVLNIKAGTPKSDPVLDTVTGLFEGAALYEIEICNLFGIHIKGIPEDIRYPLPDDWPEGQHPLRKDWKQQAADSGSEGEQ